jgi:hypothetical protein
MEVRPVGVHLPDRLAVAEVGHEDHGPAIGRPVRDEVVKFESSVARGESGAVTVLGSRNWTPRA